MKKRGERLGRLVALAVILLWPRLSPAAEYNLGLELADTYTVQSNNLDRYTWRFDRDRSYNLLTVAPILNLSLEENALIYLRGDLQWRYEPGADPQREDSDHKLDTIMTSAYLSVGDKPVQLVFGLQPVAFGNGLITADDAPGVTMVATHHRWTLKGQGAKVMENSPMAGLTLGYTPGPFERLSLFGAWFRDDENAFARTLPDFFQLFEPTSRGELWWLGGEAELFVGPARLTLTSAYERGEITFHHLFGQVRRDVEAYLADAALSMNLNSWLSAELFFFIASGDDEVTDKTVHAFISPVPYNPRALIFFDPEWLDRNTTSVVTYGGGTIYGVAAPGISLSMEPVAQMLLQLTWALFSPQQTPSDDRDQYGWEIDLKASYPLRRYLDLYLEAARFQYGAYFKNADGQIPDDALLISIGCRASF